MKFILAANIVENNHFFNFLEHTLATYPEANVMLAGDIINMFPETREDLSHSLIYELYGQLVLEEMDKLVRDKFRKFRGNSFHQPLENTFLPTGEYYQKSKKLALRRYERFFAQAETILGKNEMYFVSGDMDYADLANSVTRTSGSISSIDYKVINKDGTKIAGLGGAPNTLHAIPYVVDIAPNHMAAQEFKRRLSHLWGVDVLLTHIAPEENSDLMDFVKKSPLKVLVCRSPFNFKNKTDVRGDLEITKIKDTHVIKLNPFQTYEYKSIIIELSKGKLYPDLTQVFDWNCQAVA